ncbi:esterase/lipase family protein [Flavobacterium okayamense]|nr:alpha/beta fold hydrolase [Flavobacterium okayamense]
MKKTTFYSFLFLLISSFIFAQNITYKERNPEFEYFDFSNDTIVIPLKTPLGLDNKTVFTSKLPYPIIFIHGLNSSSETWNSSSNFIDFQYGFTFGGRFDYCLNANENDGNTNTNFYPTANADIAAFDGTTIQNGDYYYVNFRVNSNGSIGDNQLSNQAAIVKQGKAVKNAVERVLTLTGKDKVILVGHSMGGLASREYIQNSYNWQADNQHHVAKFLTVGTPHGGSNASDTGLGWFAGIDTHSEAIRDLKITYYYSGDQGRYLFGGIEVNNSSNMNEHLFGADFFNYDVNCNGAIGDNVTGINQKPIDNLIDFSCIIGKVNGSSTDGVVTETSAKMNNYFPSLTYPAKYFYYTSIGIENHTALPSQYFEIFQGLDEPQVKELAYTVETNKDYIGFTTIQETSSNSDIDIYKFNISDPMIVNINVSDIVTSQMTAEIQDMSGSTITPISNNSGSFLNFTATLASGDYYLKLTSITPTSSNYLTPYQFNIATTLDTDNFVEKGINVYPNPFSNSIYLDQVEFTKGYVYSILGEKVLEFDNSLQTLDTSEIAKGIYIITLENSESNQSFKMIKE